MAATAPRRKSSAAAKKNSIPAVKPLMVKAKAAVKPAAGRRVSVAAKKYNLRKTAKVNYSDCC